ncbi:unnamed protein product [Cuscuta epithymum]|uniref:Uncharacterized protein n=1 Tax=Cuscuta epithymum TaxID=186058 RepID=A0AAV0EFQ3_9ASTE|nr:unnamed protein product [Cuscuta epithymum]
MLKQQLEEHLLKELLNLPVDILKPFAGTKGLITLNSWILYSLGKDGTKYTQYKSGAADSKSDVEPSSSQGSVGRKNTTVVGSQNFPLPDEEKNDIAAAEAARTAARAAADVCLIVFVISLWYIYKRLLNK